MLTVAAINYMCDQNEPSRPFLLELDVPGEPTIEQIKEAMLDIWMKWEAEAYEESKRIDPDDDELLEPSRSDFNVTASAWGDLEIGNDDTLFIVTLPDKLAARLGLRSE